MFLRLQVFTIGAIIALQGLATAQVNTAWIADPAEQSYSNPANWTNGVPKPADTAIFEIGGPFKVVMDDFQSVIRILHQAGEFSLVGPAGLRVTNKLELENDFNVTTGAIFESPMGLTVGVNGDAAMQVTSESVLAALAETD